MTDDSKKWPFYSSATRNVDLATSGTIQRGSKDLTIDLRILESDSRVRCNQDAYTRDRVMSENAKAKGIAMRARTRELECFYGHKACAADVPLDGSERQAARVDEEIGESDWSRS